MSDQHFDCGVSCGCPICATDKPVKHSSEVTSKTSMKTREIKFRAWDNDNKTMRYAGFIVYGGKMYFIDMLCGDNTIDKTGEIEQYLKLKLDNDAPALIDFAEWSDETHALMQYTGLKDRTGKEIYEGDIVKTPIWDGCGTRVDVVAWRSGQAGFVEAVDTDISDWATMDNAREYEVIGNIYESPELLENNGKPGKP